MNLYAHQQKIIDDDPTQTGLFLGTGSGKTRTALMLARGKTLVICPKTQKEDKNWERERNHLINEGYDFGPRSELHTITFDIFKKSYGSLPIFDTVIVDEAHGMLGVTANTRFRKRIEIPKASQRFEALDAYVDIMKPRRLYLCSATIIKSPMTVWAAAKLLYKPKFPPNFFDFRNEFYTKLPMPGRAVYVSRSDKSSKEKLAALVRSLGYVGRLEDFFDVPEQNFITRHIELTPTQKERIKELTLEFPEPIVRIGKKHQVENGCLAGNEFAEPEVFENAKIDAILEYALEFPRMVVFARYTMQIQQIHAALVKAGYKALIMDGSSSDRGTLIKWANESEQCVFIVQAQISAGWELPEYPVMVFASRTYSFVDYDQALGRIQRANNIKKNLYINLVVKGGVDEAVDRSLTNKCDFNEQIYAEQV